MLFMLWWGGLHSEHRSAGINVMYGWAEPCRDYTTASLQTRLLGLLSWPQHLDVLPTRCKVCTPSNTHSVTFLEAIWADRNNRWFKNGIRGVLPIQASLILRRSHLIKRLWSYRMPLCGGPSGTVLNLPNNCGFCFIFSKLVDTDGIFFP